MLDNNRLTDAYRERIINKSMFRLRHWMQKEMHRPWPNTDKKWRLQQRCRRYEQQLDALSKTGAIATQMHH